MKEERKQLREARIMGEILDRCQSLRRDPAWRARKEFTSARKVTSPTIINGILVVPR